jgi:hypothetical protein
MSQTTQPDDDEATINHDDAAPIVSDVTVDASSGIKPPAEIVAFAEDSHGVYHLKTDSYDTRSRMVFLSSIGVSHADTPDGWEIAYASPRDGDLKLVLAERRDE